MNKIIFMALLFLGVCVVSYSASKVEHNSYDAKSVVIYGYNGTTLVPIKTNTNGVLSTR